MCYLTPQELINAFPVPISDYDVKTQIKDCYSTMAKMRKLNVQKPIGAEIEEFLLDFRNVDIMRFQQQFVRVLDDVTRRTGEWGMTWVESGIDLYLKNEKKMREEGRNLL